MKISTLTAKTAANGAMARCARGRVTSQKHDVAAARATLRVALEDIEVGGLHDPHRFNGLTDHDVRKSRRSSADERRSLRHHAGSVRQLATGTFGGGCTTAWAQTSPFRADRGARRVVGALAVAPDGEPQSTSLELPFIGYQSLPIAWN